MWLQWQYSWTTGQSFQSILLVRFHRTNILIGKQGFCLFKWSLIYLRALNSNNFTGSIPPSLGKLSNLYWLDLADNQLTGSLPVSTSQSSGLDLLLKAKHLWVFFFPGNTILCERKKTYIYKIRCFHIPSTSNLQFTLWIAVISTKTSCQVPFHLNFLALRWY